MSANADRVRALHDRLTAQVETLARERTRPGSSRSPHGSTPTRVPNNVLLILAQRPDATPGRRLPQVAAPGPQVNKGAKGTAILAPCVYRCRPVDEADPGENPAVAAVLRGFTVVHVFDEADTAGEPIPEAAPVLLEISVCWGFVATPAAFRVLASSGRGCPTCPGPRQRPSNGRAKGLFRMTYTEQSLRREVLVVRAGPGDRHAALNPEAGDQNGAAAVAERGLDTKSLHGTATVPTPMHVQWGVAGWRLRAACQGTDPDLFFPGGTMGVAADQTQAAKAVCRSWRVREACLQFALENSQEVGIWGGTSEEERRRLRRIWLLGRRQRVVGP